MTADNTSKSETTSSAPQWAAQPFREFVSQAERLDQLLHLSIKGISMIETVPEILDILWGEDGGAAERIESAKREADLARREVSEGFPVLHGHATIALWSALEAAVRLFLVRWLENHKPAMEVEAVQKLRVKIGEYERLDSEDRFFYIVDKLEQELSAPLKYGVTRFESLLDPFGLSGPIEEGVRRDLFELSQVRNTLVHRSGVVDRRLVENCPWMQLRIGELLRPNHEATRRYFGAVMGYAKTVVVRVWVRLGVDINTLRKQSHSVTS